MPYTTILHFSGKVNSDFQYSIAEAERGFFRAAVRCRISEKGTQRTAPRSVQTRNRPLYYKWRGRVRIPTRPLFACFDDDRARCNGNGDGCDRDDDFAHGFSSFLCVCCLVAAVESRISVSVVNSCKMFCTGLSCSDVCILPQAYLGFASKRFQKY